MKSLATRIVTFAIAGSLAAIALAQSNKPVKIIVGFPPGGGIDLIARTLQPALAEELKTTVIVENKPGAGGVVAAQELARATPDGSTILIANMGPFALAPNMAEKRPYDPVKDFTQIAQTTGAAYIICIRRFRLDHAFERRAVERPRRHEVAARSLQRQRARCHRSHGRDDAFAR
jgi:tripartite-type tricarboxylate transporter receptor subunit TctC